MNENKNHHVFMWIVPLVSFLLAAYLIYQNYDYYGYKIQIQFENANGIAPEKTPIKYKGVLVGKVMELTIDEKTKMISVNAGLKNEYKHLAMEGTTFSLVTPEVGMDGVKALGTIFSGPYINLVPGNGKLSKNFNGILGEMEKTIGRPEGLPLLLYSKKNYSLNTNDPVYYRGMQVGKIFGVSLSTDSRHVMVNIVVEYKYDQLVRQNSVFWNVGKVRADIGIFGGEFEIPSFDAFLKGGVEFATPTEAGDQAPANFRFKLHPKQSAEWETWSPSISE